MKSGGKEIFCTDLMPTAEFSELVMEPVKRGLASKAKMSRIIGEAGSMSLLEAAEFHIVESSKAIEASSDVAPLELEDNSEVDPVFKDMIDDEELVVSEAVASAEDEQKVSDDVAQQAVSAMMGEQSGKE